MKKYDWLDILFWFCVFVLAFVFGCSITSCSVLHKNKTIQKVDSVHVQKSHVDSSVNKDSTALHKSTTVTTSNTDTSKLNEQTTTTETTVIKEFDTSGKLLKKTTKKKKTETIRSNSLGKHDSSTTASKIDSTAFIEHAGIVKDWSDSSHVKSYTKDKQVKRSSISFYWWLLLLLALAYIVYRNRGKIKDFIIHITTGL